MNMMIYFIFYIISLLILNIYLPAVSLFQLFVALLEKKVTEKFKKL